MVTNSSEKVSSTTPFNASFWNAKRWFAFLSVTLVVWVVVYLFVHNLPEYKGYEYVHFDKTQIRQINTILTTESSVLPINVAEETSDITTEETYPLSESTPPPKKYRADNNIVTTSCDLDCRTEKVLLYIRGEFDEEVSAEQLATVAEYIKTFGPEEVGIFLADYKLKVRSFFWLTGPLVYGEIIFWVIIGVICSLLFAIGNVVRRSGGFNSNEIIYQVAKIFYAPFSAIIIVLAYSYFKNDTTLNIDANEGVIVFAFVAGLYSGRVMGFMDKLKQLLLPSGNIKQAHAEVTTPAKAHTVVVKEEQPKVVTTATTSSKTVKAEEKRVTDEEILREMDSNYMPPVEEEKKKGDESEIGEVDIDLKLDFSGLFDEERDELQRKGFSKAIVTLHNVNGKDIIPAKKHEDDTSTFVANDVKPGIYIARATLSQRLKDDHIINLFGEKTAYVTIDKPGLELYVKKYESVE